MRSRFVNPASANVYEYVHAERSGVRSHGPPDGWAAQPPGGGRGQREPCDGSAAAHADVGIRWARVVDARSQLVELLAPR